MTAKRNPKGGYRPALSIGVPIKRNHAIKAAERDERREIADKHRQLKVDFRRRERLRRDRGRKR